MSEFDDYRSTLDTTQLLMSANCCRHAFEAGAQSRQAEIDDLHKVNINLLRTKQNALREVDELQKRIDDALKAMDGESVNSWGLWKEKADMYEQGASNAYEKSYWILKGTTNEQ